MDAGVLPRLQGAGVLLDTCLRQLAFGLAPRPALPAGDRAELHTGPAAYRLLLEVASGLKSAVPGETNVSGQFRRAAADAATALAPPHWQALEPLLEALLVDTRSLRAKHLQGLAGSSYGSLVRALMKPRPDARVLFIGTGELARSMLPLFSAFAVATWNHRPSDKSDAALAGVSRRFATDEADSAAAFASHVVFTTPRDAGHDGDWQQRLRHCPLDAVVHLGQRRGEGPGWPSAAKSFCLDDVFELAAARSEFRERQLSAAHEACAELLAARLGERAESGRRQVGARFTLARARA